MARKVTDPHAEQQELLDCYAGPLNVVLAPNGEVRLIKESAWEATQGRQIQRLTVSPEDRSVLQTEWLINWHNAEQTLGNAGLLDGQFWGAVRTAFVWHKIAYHARTLVDAGWVVRRSQGGLSPWRLTKARSGFPAMAADRYLPAWVPPAEHADESFLPSLGPELMPSGDVRWTLRFAGSQSVAALAVADWSDDVGFAALVDRATGADRDVLPVEFALAQPGKVARYKREQIFSTTLERLGANLASANKRVNLTAARHLLETSPYTIPGLEELFPPNTATSNRELVVAVRVPGTHTSQFPQWLSENLGKRKRIQLIQINKTGGNGWRLPLLVGDDVSEAIEALLLKQYFRWTPWDMSPRLRTDVDDSDLPIINSKSTVGQYDIAMGTWKRIPTPTIESVLNGC